MSRCRLGISFGKDSLLYSFPGDHPMNKSRLALFAPALEQMVKSETAGNITMMEPVAANEQDLLIFHRKEYINHVKELSKTGEGDLNFYDTPAFKGVYEASLFPVGSTLIGLRGIMDGRFDHFFNPVGGLHHASENEARGFCVFNDSTIAISKALLDFKLGSVAYIDIDAHHGDGIYYEFEPDPRVIIGDIHEDGRYLYPGTGSERETGKALGIGTKLNIPLPPGSNDAEFFKAVDRVEEFVRGAEPKFIFFQCGSDGLAGDPTADLKYTPAAHMYATRKFHKLAHEICNGRILAMGGGGYKAENVSAAWSEVAKELSGKYEE